MCLWTNYWEELCWHKSCYAKYTDKVKINRLRKFINSTNAKPLPPEISVSPTLHSKTSFTDWELCMLCQDRETSKKQTLCSVTTFKMSKQILEGAQYDHDISLHVAGIDDLIAAEGKYHPNCYKNFLRNVSRSIDIAKDESGVVLSWLIDEKKKSAEQSHIFELKEVWLRYCSLAAEQNMAIPIRMAEPALTLNTFEFNGEYYKQTGRVAMDSCLSFCWLRGRTHAFLLYRYKTKLVHGTWMMQSHG